MTPEQVADLIAATVPPLVSLAQRLVDGGMDTHLAQEHITRILLSTNSRQMAIDAANAEIAKLYPAGKP